MRKMHFLLFTLASISLLLSSCSSTEFMKRKYMPGHFSNDPVSMKGNSVSNTAETACKQVRETGHTGTSELPSFGNSSIILPGDNPGGFSGITPSDAFTVKEFLRQRVVSPLKKLVSLKTPKPLLKSSDHRKGMAWLSLIFGLLTFYPLVFSSITAALLAIIFGMIAIHRVNKDSSEYGGKGIAFIGMLLGIIGVALVVLGVIALAAA